MVQVGFQHAFYLRHHWWFDAGLAGLYNIAMATAKREEAKYDAIKWQLDRQGLIFQAPSQAVLKEFLDDCYLMLAEKHWNVSTSKQREAKDLVIYHQDEDKLDLIPRRNPTPIPALFTKGSSYRAEQAEEYEKLSKDMRERVDSFLKEHNKTLWGSKKLLLYVPPVCHPQIELFQEKGRKSTCSVCGQESVCNDVAQPSFLLFASKSAALSFNSEGKRPDKLCWECEFLSKFAIESAHYKSSGDDLYLLQIAIANAEKLVGSHKLLGSQSAVRLLDNDTFRANIGTQKIPGKLLYYANLSYELLWAFFHDTYNLLRDDARKRVTANDEFEWLDPVKPLIENPVNIMLLAISSKGQTFILKETIAYTETAYVFRLLQSFRDEYGDDLLLYKVFHDLYMPGEGKAFEVNTYLRRNRILKQVLQKKPILADMEQLAFRKSSQQSFPYIGNLLEFVRHYQLIIQEGKGMTKEQVEVAVKLGQQIVLSAKEASTDSNFDRVKGDLFALRKTRTITDFLEQLNRIQFRYNITVSKHILSGMLEDVPFEDFKSYCLLAALNTYNNIKRPSADRSAE